MVSVNKKIKLFNKVLSEFLKQYNIISNEQFTIKVKEYSVLELYHSDIQKVQDLFIKCDFICLKDITLCNKINLNSINESVYNKNKQIIWKYLHDLYFITVEKVTDDLIMDSKRNINNLVNSQEIVKQVPDINSLFADSNMNDMIADLTKEVTEKLKGQDLSNLDPMDLMTGLMSGNNSINGIDSWGTWITLTPIVKNDCIYFQIAVFVTGDKSSFHNFSIFIASNIPGLSLLLKKLSSRRAICSRYFTEFVINLIQGCLEFTMISVWNKLYWTFILVSSGNISISSIKNSSTIWLNILV